MRRPSFRFRLPAGPHPLRIAIALAALLFAAALPAQAQQGANPVDQRVVVVPSSGGDGQEVLWSQLVDHVDATSLTFTDTTGRKRTVTGASLGLIFGRLGIAPATWSGISVARAEGGETAISSQQMLATADTAGIVFMDGDGVLKLLRQTTSDPPTGYELASAIDGTLRVTLAQEAKVTASRSEAYVGERIRFSATVPPGLDPARVTYEWEFNDDEEPVRTPDSIVSRSFERAGLYNVTATFYVDGRRWDPEALAPSAAVRVVEQPTGPPARREGGTGTRGRARDRGRGRGRGGAQGSVQEDDPPEQEESDPPVTPTDDSPSTPAYTPPASTPPAYTPPATPEPTPVPEPRPRPKPKPKPKPERRAPVETVPQGETVEGYLLASAGAPLPVPADGEAEARRPDELDEPSKPLHVPAVVWVLVGLGALVVLGWGLESRTTLPYFKP
jgi:hypothetical protein